MNTGKSRLFGTILQSTCHMWIIDVVAEITKNDKWQDNGGKQDD